IPYLEIRCSNTDDTGGWLANSTIYLGDDLPAGTFEDGEILLLFPEDGRYEGSPPPSCEPPAVIAVDGTSLVLPLDADLIAAALSGTTTISGTAPETPPAAPSTIVAPAPTTAVLSTDDRFGQVVAELAAA
ncbi:MAG TPA: hypothetical protein PLV68_19435, partial [Ilumatobacteraceae bacterium]|nr:hypothetical protein [Ilumatobacteraceae bacterium]